MDIHPHLFRHIVIVNEIGTYTYKRYYQIGMRIGKDLKKTVSDIILSLQLEETTIVGMP